MSKGAHDIFTLVLNFVGFYWQPKQMVISLFKAIKTIDQTLASKLVKLLNQYGLRKKIIAYVKNKGSNLNIMTIALKSIVRCQLLSLDEGFQGIFSSHVLSKAY
jgi:hypothetical protein